MKLSTQLMTLTALALQPALLYAADWDKDKDRVQAFLGVMELKNQTGQIQGGDGEPVDIDFPNMPTIGIEVETPHGEADSGLEYGINAGGGVSWRGDNTSFAGTVGGGGSVVVFRIDNSFTLAEVHLGGELDFSDTVGKIDIEGTQVLLTYSAWY